MKAFASAKPSFVEITSITKSSGSVAIFLELRSSGISGAFSKKNATGT
jgi:hypothetical protein